MTGKVKGKVKGKQAKKPKKVKSMNSRWLSIGLSVVLLVLVVQVVIPKSKVEKPVSEVLTPVHDVLLKPVYEDVQAIKPKKEVHHEAVKTAVATSSKKPVITHGFALIIDDVGYDIPALKRILSLPFPIAISIIPEAPYARKAAELAHASGHTVMLHVPMEPANPHYRAKMDGSFLTGEMSEQVIQSMLLKGLDKVPYVEGVNNHMGSLLTSMEQPMAWVMGFCKQQHLFFIDSKTSAKSVAAKVAQQYGLVWGKRRVFLDHSTDLKDMTKAWAMVQRCAQQAGGCIVIGHPHAETLKFLEHQVSTVEFEKMKKVQLLLHTS